MPVRVHPAALVGVTEALGAWSTCACVHMHVWWSVRAHSPSCWRADAHGCVGGFTVGVLSCVMDGGMKVGRGACCGVAVYRCA